jgi:hypothetical protein
MANDSPGNPGPEPLAPANVGHGQDSKSANHMHVEVYGVTNRPLINDPTPGLGDRAIVPSGGSSAKYYVAEVELTGVEGNYHAGDGPASIRMISQAEFDAAVKRSVSRPDLNQGRLGIYIHGVCTTADDAAKKGAEFSADGHETIVVEDWNTAARQRSELTAPLRWADNKTNAGLMPVIQWADYFNAQLGQAMIHQSIDHLIDNFQASNIDLVAHSRGNFILMNYLATHRRTDQSISGQQAAEPLRSVTFGHADVDSGEFLDQLPRFASAAHRFNFVYDLSDKALAASTLTNGVFSHLTDPSFVFPPLFLKRRVAEQNPKLVAIPFQERVGHDGRSIVHSAIERDVQAKGYHQVRFIPDQDTGDPVRHALSSKVVGDILR